MDQTIEEFNEDDARDVSAKRKWVRDHYVPDAQHEYDTVAGKLHLLDVILKAGWIERTEQVKLQSLGVTFGDALAQHLSMKWMAVDDEQGRSPALVLEGTSIRVFPQTMISKRIECGEEVDVHRLFQAICDKVIQVRQMELRPDTG